MKDTIFLIFFLLSQFGVTHSAAGQAMEYRAVKWTAAFATACIVEPLSIGKTADLVWVRKAGSESDPLSLQDLEINLAGFEVSARPAVVCFLSLPTSVNAYSGEDWS